MNYRTTYQLVKEFHNIFQQPVLTKPAFPDVPRRNLRLDLIDEEYRELFEAHDEGDIVGVADALGDLSYVIAGMAVEYGIDLDAVIKEIHRSNMSKLGEDGKPIFRGDGKVLKGQGFFKPNLKKVLKIK